MAECIRLGKRARGETTNNRNATQDDKDRRVLSGTTQGSGYIYLV